MTIGSVHMVEAGGRGGVFQHSLAVAAALQSTGVEVTLHTAADSEIETSAVTQCRCIRWNRGSHSRRLRQAGTTLRFVTRTLPHLRRSLRRGDVLWVQGLFGLTPEVITTGRWARVRVVCSPHNTFARDRAAGAHRALRAVLRSADRVLVYSQADADRVAGLGDRVGVVPLAQWLPPVSEERTARWRAAFGPAGHRVALLAGQVRSDKNPDQFVRAVSTLPGWRGAVVGEDRGAGSALAALIDATGAPVTTFFDYFPVDDFAAAIAAADVVVAPYAVASQSGVVSLARSLGIPTAVTPVGGLGELATAVSIDGSAEELGRAIVRAAEAGEPVPAAEELGRLYLDQLSEVTRGGSRR